VNTSASIRAAITVCALGLLVSACGSQATTRPDAAADGPAEMENLAELFSGGVEQVAAGRLVQWHRFQDPIVECMAREGFTYVPPPPDLERIAEPEVSTAYFAEPAPDLGVGSVALALSDNPAPPANPHYLDLSDRERARYDEALDTKCAESATGYQNIDVPEESYELQALLDPVIHDVEGELTPQIEAYLRCMADKGYDVRSQLDLRETFVARYARASEPVGSDAWTDLYRDEKRAASVDAECRADLYQQAMEMLGPRIVSWRAEHAEAIASLAAEWTDLVEKAAAYPEWSTVAVAE
jgi:hypothetical protein